MSRRATTSERSVSASIPGSYWHMVSPTARVRSLGGAHQMRHVRTAKISVAVGDSDRSHDVSSVIHRECHLTATESDSRDLCYVHWMGYVGPRIEIARFERRTNGLGLMEQSVRIGNYPQSPELCSEDGSELGREGRDVDAVGLRPGRAVRRRRVLGSIDYVVLRRTCDRARCQNQHRDDKHCSHSANCRCRLALKRRRAELGYFRASDRRSGCRIRIHGRHVTALPPCHATRGMSGRAAARHVR
jgi:hypothetical protein